MRSKEFLSNRINMSHLIDIYEEIFNDIYQKKDILSDHILVIKPCRILKIIL
jgi:hypothetical protein